MKRLSFLLFAALLSLSAVVQAQTIFPTEFTAPAEFNTGTVHISVLSRSDRQMTPGSRSTDKRSTSLANARYSARYSG